MLTNEKYKGDAELQKGHTVDFLTKERKQNNGELQKFYIEEDHDAIIDSEIWECVQLEIRRRNEYLKEHSLKSYSCRTETNPFFGKVICGECNNAFGRKTWKSAGKQRKIWQCNERYREKGSQGCNNRHIEESSIETVFITAWNTLIDNIDKCKEKWQKQLTDRNLLTAYRAKDFLKLTEKAEHIEKLELNLLLRTLDHITIFESGNIVVTFLDETEVDY